MQSAAPIRYVPPRINKDRTYVLLVQGHATAAQQFATYGPSVSAEVWRLMCNKARARVNLPPVDCQYLLSRNSNSSSSGSDNDDHSTSSTSDSVGPVSWSTSYRTFACPSIDSSFLQWLSTDVRTTQEINARDFHIVSGAYMFDQYGGRSAVGLSLLSTNVGEDSDCDVDPPSPSLEDEDEDDDVDSPLDQEEWPPRKRHAAFQPSGPHREALALMLSHTPPPFGNNHEIELLLEKLEARDRRINRLMSLLSDLRYEWQQGEYGQHNESSMDEDDDSYSSRSEDQYEQAVSPIDLCSSSDSSFRPNEEEEEEDNDYRPSSPAID